MSGGRVITISPSLSRVTIDTPYILNSGADSVTVTLTVVDDRGNPVQGLAAARCVLGVDNATGITLTQPTGATDRNGQISGSAVGTSAGSKAFSFTVCSRAITETATVTVAASAPLLYDDFSQYADRAELLDVGVGGNPWTAMFQVNAITPGEFIYLDTDPPDGAIGGKAMRYWFEGTPNACSPDSGGGAQFTLSPVERQLWTEVRVQFSPTFTTENPEDGCGVVAAAYKFLFHSGSGFRSDIGLGVFGTDTIVSIDEDPYYYVGAGDNGGVFSYFLDSKWHIIRLQSTLPTTPGGSDGALKAWIDGSLVVNQSGLTVASNEFNSIRLGANINRSPEADQNLWWDYVMTFDTNPGWV